MAQLLTFTSETQEDLSVVVAVAVLSERGTPSIYEPMSSFQREYDAPMSLFKRLEVLFIFFKYSTVVSE